MSSLFDVAWTIVPSCLALQLALNQAFDPPDGRMPRTGQIARACTMLSLPWTRSLAARASNTEAAAGAKKRRYDQGGKDRCGDGVHQLLRDLARQLVANEHSSYVSQQQPNVVPMATKGGLA